MLRKYFVTQSVSTPTASPTVLLATSLMSLCAMLLAACGAPGPTPTPTETETPSPVLAPAKTTTPPPTVAPAMENAPLPPTRHTSHSSYGFPPLGWPELDEIVFEASAIARVRLKGTGHSAELHYTKDDGSKVYRGLVKFTFEVLEYLKGNGGSELAAYATVSHRSEVIQDLMDRNARGEFTNQYEVDWSNPYTTMEGALAAAKKWEKDRDTQWDKREAIVLVNEEAVPGSSDGSKRYSLGSIHYYPINFRSKVWLPAAIAGAGANVSTSEARFLVEPPLATGTPAAGALGVSATPATDGVRCGREGSDSENGEVAQRR